jgi:hypothetical protein
LVDENVNTGAQEVTSYTTKVLYMHVHIIWSGIFVTTSIL